MIDINSQKKRFENHLATLTDHGNVKILDFKKPGSNEYRIRFLFEEDYYRLHISGDLGHLTATNYYNMRYEGFADYVHNPEYFEGKIDCMDRPLYVYDESLAKKQLLERYERNELAEAMEMDEDDYDDDFWFNDALDNMFGDFDDKRGIGQKTVDVLKNLDDDYWEWAYDLGKENTGILEVYMLAFELATEQLQEREG